MLAFARQSNCSRYGIPLVSLLLSCLFLCTSFGSDRAYRRLQEALRNPERVKKLDLSNGSFVQLPAEINTLVNLEKLILFNNELESLPPEIGDLKKLKRLSLSRNNLTKLPAEIGNLEEFELSRSPSVRPRSFNRLFKKRSLFNATLQAAGSHQTLKTLTLKYCNSWEVFC